MAQNILNAIERQIFKSRPAEPVEFLDPTPANLYGLGMRIDYLADKKKKEKERRKSCYTAVNPNDLVENLNLPSEPNLLNRHGKPTQKLKPNRTSRRHSVGFDLSTQLVQDSKQAKYLPYLPLRQLTIRGGEEEDYGNARKGDKPDKIDHMLFVKPGIERKEKPLTEQYDKVPARKLLQMNTVEKEKYLTKVKNQQRQIAQDQGFDSLAFKELGKKGITKNELSLMTTCQLSELVSAKQSDTNNQEVSLTQKQMERLERITEKRQLTGDLYGNKNTEAPSLKINLDAQLSIKKGSSPFADGLVHVEYREFMKLAQRTFTQPPQQRTSPRAKPMKKQFAVIERSPEHRKMSLTMGSQGITLQTKLTMEDRLQLKTEIKAELQRLETAAENSVRKTNESSTLMLDAKLVDLKNQISKKVKLHKAKNHTFQDFVKNKKEEIIQARLFRDRKEISQHFESRHMNQFQTYIKQVLTQPQVAAKKNKDLPEPLTQEQAQNFAQPTVKEIGAFIQSKFAREPFYSGGSSSSSSLSDLALPKGYKIGEDPKPYGMIDVVMHSAARRKSID